MERLQNMLVYHLRYSSYKLSLAHILLNLMQLYTKNSSSEKPNYTFTADCPKVLGLETPSKNVN